MKNKKCTKCLQFKSINKFRYRDLFNKIIATWCYDCYKNYSKQYIQSQFKKGMSWNNYGFYGWHVDHIKPCAKFDLSKSSQQNKCFHYSNLQPLWAEENWSKNGK